MDITTHQPSTAERLDDALDRSLTGDKPAVEPELRLLVDTAALVSAALPPIPAGDAFGERVANRLRRTNPVTRVAGSLGDMTRRELRHPSRLLLTGAVSSAAVGVTAFAVWRGRGMRRAGHR